MPPPLSPPPVSARHVSAARLSAARVSRIFFRRGSCSLQFLALLAALWLVASSISALAAEAPAALKPLPAPAEFKAFDIPGDRGESIGFTWAAAPDDADKATSRTYILLEAPSPEGPFKEAQSFSSNSHFQSDEPKYFGFSKENKKHHFLLKDLKFEKGKSIAAYFKLAVSENGRRTETSQAVTAVPKANWYAPHKTNNLILTLFCCGFVLFFIFRASKNPNLFIRKLAGLEAIDEAIGRATEMGRPILYMTGYHDMDQVSTIASVNILSHVSRKAADYDSRLIVPCKWSIAMTVCQEVVKESYMNAGRPDAYNPQDVYFIAGEQFSYTAAVDGVIVREKPASIFLMGTFAAEALILAETGASTNAIQISGTDSAYQIPFFVVACDYCLIGEELYAASAYLSREPKLLGSLKGQDAGKLLLMAALLLSNAALVLNIWMPADILVWIKNFFQAL